MTMTLGLRKFVLTVHLTFSVGWIGAVVAYLALGVSAVTSRDAQVAQSPQPKPPFPRLGLQFRTCSSTLGLVQ
jgi:hypothetical protein